VAVENGVTVGCYAAKRLATARPAGALEKRGEEQLDPPRLPAARQKAIRDAVDRIASERERSHYLTTLRLAGLAR
jgi:hypothetical protein